MPSEVVLFPRPASAATLAALAADRYEYALDTGSESAMRDVERLLLAASDAGEREDRLAEQLERIAHVPSEPGRKQLGPRGGRDRRRQVAPRPAPAHPPCAAPNCT